jgi:predicted nuclease with RNAse H fold
VNPVYLGVDVAGASNTWVTALSPGEGGLDVVLRPRLASLQEIVGYCEENDVVAAAIDAQLTIALSEENGYRTSDLHLREELPGDCQNWVMSFNGLMAVPVRGRLLADHLSPTVGTLLETHPRASLLFGLGHVEKEIRTAVRKYKSKKVEAETRRAHVRTLWRHWSERFGILPHEPVYYDGALDSLVCATVAHLYHHEPAALHRLRHEVAGKVRRGPFYVLAPNTMSALRGA